jgi:hypothetical protein
VLPFIASKISFRVGMGMSYRTDRCQSLYTDSVRHNTQGYTLPSSDLIELVTVYVQTIGSKAHWLHLDVVEVDIKQAAVVFLYLLKGLLHVCGVGGLVWEDLECIWFYYA